MDEPCSALDPISTLAIEDLIHELKDDYTIVIVTHNMQQAARVIDTHRVLQHRGTGKPGQAHRVSTTPTDLLATRASRPRRTTLRPLRLTRHPTYRRGGRPWRFTGGSAVAELVQPVVLDAEVVRDLVDDRHPHLVAHASRPTD